MKYIYEATENLDKTEGRGPMVTTGLFYHLEHAVEAVQGGGVMGFGTGTVNRIPIFESFEEFQTYTKDKKFQRKEAVYGYRKDWKGQWTYGYVDNRDAPTKDADYVLYKELQEKLQKKYRGKVPE